jgi:hypothetical protein
MDDLASMGTMVVSASRGSPAGGRSDTAESVTRETGSGLEGVYDPKVPRDGCMGTDGVKRGPGEIDPGAVARVQQHYLVIRVTKLGSARDSVKRLFVAYGAKPPRRSPRRGGLEPVPGA